MTATVADTPSPLASSTSWADRVDALEYPTRRDEAWRYAPHADLGALSFGPGAEPATVDATDVASQIPSLDGPSIVIVNGVVDRQLSTLDAPEGVHLSTIGDAISAHPELVTDHFSADRDPADAFEALNLAFGRDGAVVRIDGEHRLDVPIHIVDIVIPGEAQNAFASGVVIDMGAGSSATIVETRLGGGTAFGGSNVRTTITLGDDAALDHIVLQALPAEQLHLGRIEVRQGAGSAFRAMNFNIGGAYGRFAYHVDLAAEGARSDLSGLYFGRGAQTLDQQITVVHGAKDCVSRQAFRGVLDDESTGVFNGGIDVRPGADGTDAEQSNDNLLLSRRAEVNTQPRLEILADEVACKHGATVGQLDESALYYMRSRGIPGDEAQRLLVEGFADQVVDDVEIEAVRAWVIRRLGHDHA